MPFHEYRTVWLAHFEYTRTVGERPEPVALAANEFRGTRTLRVGREELARGMPYDLGPDTLLVVFDGPAFLGCHLALGWPMPARILDLHAEFMCLTSGLRPPGDYTVTAALAHFGRRGDGLEGLETLLDALMAQLDLPRALLRGRYTAAVARVEATGVPLDVEGLARLRGGWGRITSALIARVDGAYGVYREGRFSARLWEAWTRRRAINWPRRSGKLILDADTFADMAQAHPEVRPMKELRASLSLLRSFRLAVGADGRNRAPLRPFASKTGRNQPRTTEFIFGRATWVRGFIKPARGRALAYLDYEQQEFGIAAALSGDLAMKEAYRSGDPYLTFAKQAGAVPFDATKASHRDERERFKLCALGVQYGMGARSLAVRLNVTTRQAAGLLRLHRRTYPTYWAWSDEVERQGFKNGRLLAAFGWALNIPRGANGRSVRNFPLQANGAEMLRLACCSLTEGGVRVCAPVHDALLIEASEQEIEGVVETCRKAMERASELVLSGFPLRTEAKVVRHPGRYMDPRGRGMWDTVTELLEASRPLPRAG